MSLVSIVLVHYRDTEDAAAALESVWRETREHDLELIIVDNEGNRRARERLLSLKPEATWLTAPDNPGFATAVNLALQRASGDWILLLNPDARLHEGTLDRCLAFAAKQDTEPDVIGCRHIGLDGSFQRSSFPRATWPGPLAALANQPLARPFLRHLAPDSLAAKNEDAHRRQHLNSHATDAVQGSFLLVRRKAALRVGGFDADFFLYCEEIDFCHRIRKTGGAVLYCAEATVLHGGTSRRESIARQRQAALSEDLLVRKLHGGLGYGSYLLLRYLNLAMALTAWPLLSKEKQARVRTRVHAWRPFDSRHLLIPVRYGRHPNSSASPLRAD